jgi:predicted permease
MKVFASLKSFARASILRSRMEREMNDEMRFHLEARAADLQRQGFPRAVAERRAAAEFGDVVRWKEAGREARGLRIVDDLGADLRYAVRTMRRAPGFTAAAVVSIALGIGANTAIFGLMDLLLLRTVPVRNPHELVHITTVGERSDGSSGSSNYPWFREVASRSDLFSDAMLVRHDLYKVGIRGRVEPIVGQRVTTNYYNVLGVSPILGRTFVPADQPESGGSPVAVISYGLWQRGFAGDPNVLGASITVDQQLYTIIGVTPPAFRGILVGWTMDVTTPLDGAEFLDPHNWVTMPLIARVKPGVDVVHIRQQIEPLLQRFVATGVAERFRRRYLEHVAVESAARGISDLRVEFSSPLRLLMAAVGVLLLIACVNLAGLLIARNVARQHEIAMRVALGASRTRIMRQLLTESALLALVGATPGVLLAIRSSNLLLEFLPQYFGPVSIAVTADWRILTFALAATMGTTLLFGLLPAWQAARSAVSPVLHRTNPRISTTRIRVGQTLVVAQFALSIVLVAGAVLLLRTLVNLSRVDIGFDREHVLVVQMDPQGTGYENERLRAFQRDMLTALAALPGVRRVSLSTSSPFNGNIDGKRLTVPGVASRDPDDSVIQVNLVGPDYFDVFQVPILQGRPIDSRDQMNSAPVAVVSEAFARRYFGDAAAAVGRRFTTGRGDSAVTYEIVGVARDLRYQTLRTPSERLAYLPWFQARDVRLAPFEFVLRTDGNPANWINMTRTEITRLRPDAPILDVRTMSGVINSRLLTERLLATLGSFFALVALILAAVGGYGLLAHLVARRVPEIGVRLALGARPGQLMWMTIGENLLLAVAGSAVGIAAAAAGLRVLDGLLFGLSPSDVVNLGSAALILILVSLAAAIVPARRAATVDPLVALRYE